MDDAFALGEDAIDAMIGDFKGKRFREVPNDPRSIDPGRLRALRERLTDKYHYQWRATRANGEIVDALYHTVVTGSPFRYGLCIDKIAVDEKGTEPPVHVAPGGHARVFMSDEYVLHYYITACSMNVKAFITDYDDAVSLLRSLLPRHGFLLRNTVGRTAVRLERDGVEGPWLEADHASLALVLAVLDHLERAPHEAQHWRKI